MRIALRLRRWLLCIACIALLGGRPPGAALAGEAPPPAPPSFAALEAAGVRIGEIRIVVADVFDTDDPKESYTLFRWANALHVTTRPEVIEAALLFRRGDPVTVRVIEETERVLRGLRFLYDVAIRPVAVRDGVVDVEVATRDTWTLSPGIGASRSGGTNTGSVAVREANLLGTGISFGIGAFSNVDRSGVEATIADERAFGGLAALAYGFARNSDGERQAVRIERPFYGLDSRWAGGLVASRDDRIDAVYDAGEVASEYRRRQDRTEVYAGWSAGVSDGWVRRYSIGVSAQDNAYAPEPGRVAPPLLPPDETLVGPFVRAELIEDRFEKTRNLNQIGRPEFVPFGLAATMQLGYAARTFGSTRDTWLYAATVSRGFEPAPRHTLLASATLSGRYTDAGIERQITGARAQYFLPQDRRWSFYASLSADLLTNPGPLDTLTLGGDNGLRGYPLRYQAGDRRMQLTLEERLYTDLFWFRLFRVGGAAFLDVGRAWGGADTGGADTGWLADVGFGLRIFSVRAAFTSVLHLDVAFPLGAAGDIRRVQFLVKNKTSF